MTKQQADALIYSGMVTWGQLKTWVRCEMGGAPRVSVVNKGMTHEQALDILARAIDGREDAEVVCHARCVTPKRDRLMARNILRECAASVPDSMRPAATKKGGSHYCGPCDVWMRYRECPFCGADTDARL